MMYRTRFAPSPTGPLHLGHAYSALLGYDRACEHGGAFLLRIEDTDRARVRPDYEAAIYDDLAWLGIRWQVPVLRQSDHLPDYDAALDRLIAMGLCYPCRCTRADIQAALSAPQEGAASLMPDGPVYPGTCRQRPMQDRQPGDAIRLDMARACAAIPAGLAFDETGALHPGRHTLDPTQLIAAMGDIVLARKDIGAAAYHLAVVVDDARQQITEVVRGADLFEATFLHVLLQGLLGLPTPAYHHHHLIRDAEGKRLAKRDDARALSRYRAEGASPQDIRRLVGLA
ncbi:MAG: tRNA glutamyl-Q(34) synthetase GluQRS [Rhodobacteraceae bacterium]|nr:tRNA glutamyl-Q(34) synthetase GluQRS [Paracoccaceae bacterium]